LNNDPQVRLSVALTGATGFVGSHVLKHLLDRGHAIKALTRSATPVTHPSLTWVSGDLQNETALAELVANTDVVVHIAGVIEAIDPQHFVEGNVEGTSNLLAAINGDATSPPHKFIHLSSLAAREPSLSAYGASKAEAETVVQQSSPCRQNTIVRAPAVYGPGDMETLAYFTAATATIGIVPGGASNRTSLIHVHDLAEAIAYLVEHEQPGETVLEVHDGVENGFSVRDVLEIINPGHRHSFNTIYLGLPLLLVIAGLSSLLSKGKARYLSHPDWVCHGVSMASVTGWSAKTNAHAGMQQTRKWYEEHGFLG
jgi:nucleoside-diphosphate-sugar epimerase